MLLISDCYIYIITVTPPTIRTHPMDVIADNGSSVTFTCRSFSYVSVSFTWLYNSDVIDVDPTTIITTTGTDDPYINTTTLMILNVQLPDVGNYICRAINREGPSESDPGILRVVGK